MPNILKNKIAIRREHKELLSNTAAIIKIWVQIILESNTTAERPTFTTHLECSQTGEHCDADQIQELSDAGTPLLVRYDLKALSQILSKEDLLSRSCDLWRYREFLPVRNSTNIVSLGEIMTPLIPLHSSILGLGSTQVRVKDEGRLAWQRN